jgi:excisionase family DNA binding protein
VTDRLLTLTEVAERLGCSPKTVRRRIDEGALSIFRDGRLVRVTEADLRRYIAEHVERQSRSLPLPFRASGSVVPYGSRLWDD